MLLSSLRSKGKYKRYLGSPLRYAGGKSLAVGTILEHLPENLTRVVSPFIGGGSVEVAMARELGIEVIGYDIFDLLVNFWQFLTQHPDELYEGLAQLEPTKQEYEHVKELLKGCWNKHTGANDTLTPKEKAIYYYFNHNLSYGPGFLGWMSSIYTDPKRYLSMIEKIRTSRLSNLHVEQLSFEHSIPKHNGDFLYLAPPIFWRETARCFSGSTRCATFRCITTAFDTMCWPSYCTITGEGSSSRITIATGSGRHTKISRSGRWSGSIRWGRAKHASAKIAWSATTTTAMSKPRTRC